MAASILSLANCATQGNTGGTFCNNEPSYFLYIVAVPKGTVIPASAMTTQAAFAAYVRSMLWNDTRSLRWQISPKLVSFKDDTKAPNMEELDGYENTTQWMPYNWQWRFANGFSGATKNVHQIWRMYINQQQNQFDFLFIDANNLWVGTQALDSSSLNGLGGVAVSNITVNDFKPATPKTGNVYTVQLIIQNNSELNGYYESLLSSTNTSTFKSLTDVSIVKSPVPTTITATHIYVSGRIGGNTLGKQYGTTLADVSAWVVLDTTNTGKTWATSAVSYDAVNDQYDLTGSWSSANSGDTVTVGLAAPSVMTVTPFFAPIITEGTNKYTFTAP